MSLITIVQQQQIKPISPNWSKSAKEVNGITKFEQLANEVEESKLSELLGYALLQDLQANPLTAENIVLLDGGIFEDWNGNNIAFKGLRYILAYMNYIQIISESYVNDTFSGFVKHSINESEPLNSSERKELKINSQSVVVSQSNLLKEFLNKNSTVYPLWKCTTTTKLYNPKLTGLKRTIN